MTIPNIPTDFYFARRHLLSVCSDSHSIIIIIIIWNRFVLSYYILSDRSEEKAKESRRKIQQNISDIMWNGMRREETKNKCDLYANPINTHILARPRWYTTHGDGASIDKDGGRTHVLIYSVCERAAAAAFNRRFLHNSRFMEHQTNDHECRRPKRTCRYPATNSGCGTKTKNY